MSTRLYFTYDSTPKNPSPGGTTFTWHVTDGAGRVRALPFAECSQAWGGWNGSESSAVENTNVLVATLTTNPFTTNTNLYCNFHLQSAWYENDAEANMRPALFVKLYNSNDELVAELASGIGTIELALLNPVSQMNSYINRSLYAYMGSAVDASAGDYLVFEIGVQAQNTSATTYSASMLWAFFGDDDLGDLPSNDNTWHGWWQPIAAYHFYNSWIECSTTLPLATSYPSPSLSVSPSISPSSSGSPSSSLSPSASVSPSSSISPSISPSNSPSPSSSGSPSSSLSPSSSVSPSVSPSNSPSPSSSRSPSASGSPSSSVSPSMSPSASRSPSASASPSPEISSLDRWETHYINTSGTVVTGASYDATHHLDLAVAITGSNYDGTYVMFPADAASSFLRAGSISWSVKNQPSNGIVGPIFRASEHTVKGYGYYVNIDHSFFPVNRNIEIHKGYFGASAVDTYLTNVMITGGVSGTWYEYKVDFYNDISYDNMLHMDVYTNEGSKNVPNWVLRLHYHDLDAYNPGYTGLVYKDVIQYHIQRIAGSTYATIDGYGTAAAFKLLWCMTYIPFPYDNYWIPQVRAGYQYGDLRQMESTPRYYVGGGENMGWNYMSRNITTLKQYWISHFVGYLHYSSVIASESGSANVEEGYGTDQSELGGLCTDGERYAYYTNSRDAGALRRVEIGGDYPYDIVPTVTLAGNGSSLDTDGTGTGASMRQPQGCAYYNGEVYFVCEYRGLLRKYNVATGVVTTLAGSTTDVSNDRLCGDGHLGYLGGISADGNTGPCQLNHIGRGRFLISIKGLDWQIRMYDAHTTMLSTLSGDPSLTYTGPTNGPGYTAQFGQMMMSGVCAPYESSFVFPSDTSQIWRHPVDFESEVVFGAGRIKSLAAASTTGGTAWEAVTFNTYHGVRFYNGDLYYADMDDSVLYKINARSWESTLLAGSPGITGHVDGDGESARFAGPMGVTVYNDVVYIGEEENIRAYDINTKQVSTISTGPTGWTGLVCVSLATNGTHIFSSWNHYAMFRCGMDGSNMTLIVGEEATSGLTDNATGTSARIKHAHFSNDSYNPTDNRLYFCDANAVRYVTLTGVYPVTTLAGAATSGYNDATGTSARFYGPLDLVIDREKTNLYVCDSLNHFIRKVVISSKVVTTWTSGNNPYGYETVGQIAGGWKSTMLLYYPTGMTIGGNHIYVYQYGNVMQILIDSVTMLADIDYIKIQKQEYAGFLYVADTGNDRIVKRMSSDFTFVAKTGIIAGENVVTSPSDCTFVNNNLYVLDTGDNRLVMLLTRDLSYVDYVGSYGNGYENFNNPNGITNDGTYLYIADTNNDRFVKRAISDMSYITKASNGRASLVYVDKMGTGDGFQWDWTPYKFWNLNNCCTDGTYLYLCMGSGGGRLCRVYLSNINSGWSAWGNTMEWGGGEGYQWYALTYAGGYLWCATSAIEKRSPSNFSIRYDYTATGVAYYAAGLDNDGTYLYATVGHQLVKIAMSDLTVRAAEVGGAVAGSSDDEFSSPGGVWIAPGGTYLYVADTGNNRVVKRRCDDLSYVDEGYVPGPKQVTGDPDGKFLYVTSNTYGVAAVLLSNWSIESPVPLPGIGDDQYKNPNGILMYGGYLYVIDAGNERVVKKVGYNSDTDIINKPHGISTFGDYVYIADTYSNRIVKRRCLDFGYVAYIDELPIYPYTFNYPKGTATDGVYVYVTDTENNRIVKLRCSDLTYVLSTGALGSGENQFNQPRGITTDGTYIYIADTGNSRIVKRRCSTLGYVDEIGSDGSGNDEFSGPFGLVF